MKTKVLLAILAGLIAVSASGCIPEDLIATPSPEVYFTWYLGEENSFGPIWGAGSWHFGEQEPATTITVASENEVHLVLVLEVTCMERDTAEVGEREVEKQGKFQFASQGESTFTLPQTFSEDYQCPAGQAPAYWYDMYRTQ